MKFWILIYTALHVDGEIRFGSGCAFLRTEAEALKECRDMAHRVFPYADGWRNHSFIVDDFTSFILSQEVSSILLEALKGEEE
jgi:hypothetical protein